MKMRFYVQGSKGPFSIVRLVCRTLSYMIRGLFTDITKSEDIINIKVVKQSRVYPD